MKKMKRWLIERILPVWAREQLMAENHRLTEQNLQLRQEVVRLEAYIEGLEDGTKALRRIVINTGEVKK